MFYITKNEVVDNEVVDKKPIRLNPEQKVELMLKAGLRPLVPYKSATTKWECECLKCGEVVSPMYATIQQGHGGCRSCGYENAGKARRKSIEEIESQLKLIGLELVQQNVKSSEALTVRCLKCGEIQKLGKDAVRLRKHKGCTTCARRAVSSKQVSNEQAEEEMRLKGLEPLEKYMGYKTPWRNRCLVCNKEVLIARESVRRRSPEFQGCKECAKESQNKAHVDKKREAVLSRFESFGLTLLSNYEGASKPIEVRCNRCGYEFVTFGTNLLAQKYGCGRCAGNLLDPIEAVAFMLEHGYEPMEPYTSTTTPWKCKHLECGRVMKIPLSTTKRTGGGCKYCANYGFQYSKPAYLYLIRNEALNAVKIGIANPSRRSDGDRLTRFTKLDWEVIAVWNFQKGSHAEQVEKQIFELIRKERKIPAYLSRSQMVIGGHTETMDANSVDVFELKEILNKIIKDVSQEE